jgi:lipid II:glycine glycyltransferase (peptidoglycan interpeptide bridge formation enzyme)
MTDWSLVDTEQSLNWEGWLTQFAYSSVFQNWGWGEYKQAEGWCPLRFVARDNGESILAMAQVLVRRLPGGIKFIWVPGGPLCHGASPHWDALLKSFHAQLAQVVGRCYVRCSMMQPHTSETADVLARTLNRPSVKLNSGYSVFLDLTDAEPVWLSSISSKHRYYVRKSKAAGLVWRYGANDTIFSSLVELTERMSREKSLPPQGMSLDQLVRLRTFLPDAPRALVGFLDEEPVTACLALRCGQNAFYSTAATVGRGREASAAYAMAAELRSRLRDEGVKLLDFGGIDLAPQGAGVAHFKLGFGGQKVEYLGEWEWSNLPGLRCAINLVMKYRKIGQ